MGGGPAPVAPWQEGVTACPPTATASRALRLRRTRQEVYEIVERTPAPSGRALGHPAVPFEGRSSSPRTWAARACARRSRGPGGRAGALRVRGRPPAVGAACGGGSPRSWRLKTMVELEACSRDRDVPRARRRGCARSESGRAAGWVGAARTPRLPARGGSRPSRRHRQVRAGVLAVELLHAPLEPAAVGHRTALRRGEGAQLAVPRAAVGVRLGLGSLDARHRSLDPDLSPQLRPVEEEGGPGVGVELDALAAPVVGEEGEPTLVEALHQDHARGRGAVRRRGGQRHRLRLDAPCCWPPRTSV